MAHGVHFRRRSDTVSCLGYCGLARRYGTLPFVTPAEVEGTYIVATRKHLMASCECQLIPQPRFNGGLGSWWANLAVDFCCILSTVELGRSTIEFCLRPTVSGQYLGSVLAFAQARRLAWHAASASDFASGPY